MRILILLSIVFLVSCKTLENEAKKEAMQDSQVEITGSLKVDEDPYFLHTPKFMPKEAFRILIDDAYYFKQIQFSDVLERIPDREGDTEQFERYSHHTKIMNFKNWTFEGVLSVKINPHTGNIERLNYHGGYIPQTKQALQMFMEDISRYRFRYLDDEKKNVDEFLIRIRWNITKDPQLTEEEARKKAIEYLRKSVKE